MLHMVGIFWLYFCLLLSSFFLPSTLNGKGLKFLPQLSSANYFVNMSNYHDGIRNYKKGYADICFERKGEKKAYSVTTAEKKPYTLLLTN